MQRHQAPASIDNALLPELTMPGLRGSEQAVR